jgi:molybdate/tungstate transport system substrate-binding protein
MAAYYTRPVRLTATFVALVLTACGGPRAELPRPSITVFAAASLARPLAVTTDSFERRARAEVLMELGGSLEQARKITDLGRIPDVLMLADDEVVAALAPTHIDWYVRFATNRIVVAYTKRSRLSDSIHAENWWRILSRNVTVGRADPDIAPAGRHALSLLRRAETYYKQPGLADGLLARASLRYVRPNATELAALLETGEVDYILEYESVARQYGFDFVSLPDDLTDTILYGIAVPRLAPYGRQGLEFVAFVLSEEGKRILREASVNVLSVPVAIGSNVPPEVSQFVRTITSSP